jgi:hypothetical protein
MLALGAAILALALLFRADREPFFLSIPITEYGQAFYPINAWAEQDSDALASMLAPPRSEAKGRAKAYESQDKGLLVQQLNNLRNNKDGRVVVHLSSLARTHNDEVYILPADAHPDRPESWLPLREVLQALQDCPSKQKLLILDIARPVAEPRLGFLIDDVGTTLHGTLERMTSEGKLSYWVLCGCSRDEVCLSWEEKQQSAFGYFLARGLRGHADGANPKRKRADGHVTVLDLADYVTDQVDQWARQQRNRRQTPVLFGKAGNFSLATVSHGTPKPDPELTAPAYPDWLLEGWKFRDTCWEKGKHRTAPRAFRQLETALLRAEQRWRGGLGGADQERTRKQLAGDRQLVQDALMAPVPEPPAAPSLVVEADREEEPDAKVMEGVKALVKMRLDQPETAKPEEIAKTMEKPTQALLDPLKGKPHFDLAMAAWAEALADEVPTLDKIRFLDDLLRKHAPEPKYLETLFLRRLVEMQAETKKWPAEIIARALRALREAETARMVAPALLPLVEAPLNDATKKRLEAETLLLKGSPPSGMMRAARLLEEVEGAYRQVNQFLRTAHEANRLAEDVSVKLPGFALYLVNAPQIDSRLAQDWVSAAEAVQAIHDQVNQRPPPWPPADIEKNLVELRRCLVNLEQPFRAETLQKLRNPGPTAGVKEYLQMQALLDSPRLSAGDRSALWLAAYTFGQNIPQQPAPALPVAGERALVRAQLAAETLKLGGVDPGTIPASGAGVPTATWQAVGDKLRQGFAVQLPRRYQSETDLVVRDRLARLLDPREPVGKENYTGMLVRKQDSAYWNWLGDQYTLEAEAAQGAAAKRFCSNFVTECRRMASQ